MLTLKPLGLFLLIAVSMVVGAAFYGLGVNAAFNRMLKGLNAEAA
jgi:hypothetical protein